MLRNAGVCIVTSSPNAGDGTSGSYMVQVVAVVLIPADICENASVSGPGKWSLAVFSVVRWWTHANNWAPPRTSPDVE